MDKSIQSDSNSKSDSQSVSSQAGQSASFSSSGSSGSSKGESYGVSQSVSRDNSKSMDKSARSDGSSYSQSSSNGESVGVSQGLSQRVGKGGDGVGYSHTLGESVSSSASSSAAHGRIHGDSHRYGESVSRSVSQSETFGVEGSAGAKGSFSGSSGHSFQSGDSVSGSVSGSYQGPSSSKDGLSMMSSSGGLVRPGDLGARGADGFASSNGESVSSSQGQASNSPVIVRSMAEKSADGYKSVSVSDRPDGSRHIEFTFQDQVGREYVGEVGKPAVLIKENLERQVLSINLSNDGVVSSEISHSQIERTYYSDGRPRETSRGTSSSDRGAVSPEKFQEFRDLADKVAQASSIAEASKPFNELVEAVADRDFRSNTAQAETQWLNQTAGESKSSSAGKQNESDLER